MQVNSVNNQNFKGLQCYPGYTEVYQYLTKKTSPAKINQYLYSLHNSKVPTELHLIHKDNPKLLALVDGKMIREEWYRSPLSVLKKALNFNK